jgi:uncharacterized membrane protein
MELAGATTGRRFGWGAMLFLATGIALVSSRYLVGEVGFDEQREVFDAHPVLIFCHVAGGITALLIGPWQFRSGLRARRPRLHRMLGRIYLAGIAIGVMGGAGLAPLAHGGWIARAGFACLAAAWVVTSAAALLAIRSGRVESHRRWMVRSYACTFGAVTLRLWLPILQFGVGLSFTDAYRTVAWISWVPNLLLVEYALRRRVMSAREAKSTATTSG